MYAYIYIYGLTRDIYTYRHSYIHVYSRIHPSKENFVCACFTL